MPRLILLRHGESVWNRDNLFTGRARFRRLDVADADAVKGVFGKAAEIAAGIVYLASDEAKIATGSEPDHRCRLPGPLTATGRACGPRSAISLEPNPEERCS